MILNCSMLLLPLLFIHLKKSTLSVISHWGFTLCLLRFWLAAFLHYEEKTDIWGAASVTSQSDMTGEGKQDGASQRWVGTWLHLTNRARGKKRRRGKTTSRCSPLTIKTFVKRSLKKQTNPRKKKSWESNIFLDIKQRHQLHDTIPLHGSLASTSEAKDCGKINSARPHKIKGFWKRGSLKKWQTQGTYSAPFEPNFLKRAPEHRDPVLNTPEHRDPGNSHHELIERWSRSHRQALVSFHPFKQTCPTEPSRYITMSHTVHPNRCFLYSYKYSFHALKGPLCPKQLQSELATI